MKWYLMIQHRVKEYSYWRIEYDASLDWRKSQGELDSQIFQDNYDLNLVIILSEWESLEKLQQFIAEPELSEIMTHAGVLDQPILHILRKD